MKEGYVSVRKRIMNCLYRGEMVWPAVTYETRQRLFYSDYWLFCTGGQEEWY